MGIQTSVLCLSLCSKDDDNRSAAMGSGDIYLFKIYGLRTLSQHDDDVCSVINFDLKFKYIKFKDLIRNKSSNSNVVPAAAIRILAEEFNSYQNTSDKNVLDIGY